jgi:hypothetical protein
MTPEIFGFQGGTHMEKKTYYVTMDIGQHAGEIRDFLEENDGVYDFEIQATPDEIGRLEDLFMQVQDTDFKMFWLAHIPFLDNERKENLDEDHLIRRIYRMIYELGTDETKERIRRAGIPH